MLHRQAQHSNKLPFYKVSELVSIAFIHFFKTECICGKDGRDDWTEEAQGTTSESPIRRLTNTGEVEVY